MITCMEEILIVVFLLAIYLLHLGLHAFNLINVLDDEEADCMGMLALA